MNSSANKKNWYKWSKIKLKCKKSEHSWTKEKNSEVWKHNSKYFPPILAKPDMEFEETSMSIEIKLKTKRKEQKNKSNN